MQVPAITAAFESDTGLRVKVGVEIKGVRRVHIIPPTGDEIYADVVSEIYATPHEWGAFLNAALQAAMDSTEAVR